MTQAEPQLDCREYEMKGRRKVKTSKWSMKIDLEVETRKFLQGRSGRQGRFLDAASRNGQEMEPTGRLCG